MRNKRVGFAPTIFLYLALMILSFSSFAGPKIYLGLGALVRDMNSVTSTADQSISLFSRPYPVVAFSSVWQKASMSSAISADFNYGVQDQPTAEGGGKTNVFSLGASFHKYFNKFLSVHLGTGMLCYRIKGEGGLVSQNNGGGTAVYANPDTSVTTRALYWDLGFGFDIGPVNLTSSALITGILSSRRSVSPLFTLKVAIF